MRTRKADRSHAPAKSDRSDHRSQCRWHGSGVCLLRVRHLLLNLKRRCKAFGGDGDVVDRDKGTPRLVAPLLRDGERKRFLLTFDQSEYASLLPAKIFPELADQGLRISPESSIYRIYTKQESAIAARVHGCLRSPLPSRFSRCIAPIRCGARHKLPADQGTGRVALPQFGGRCQRPQSFCLVCGRRGIG